MYVICLEGCHGTGKSELCRLFKQANFQTLDEAFIDQPKYALHPQSLCMEMNWVAHWFQRILKTQSELPESRRNSVIIADRSPFSAVFYSRSFGTCLEPIIRNMITELRTEANIHIVTVCVQTRPELLWERIQSRLKAEPFREQYNEHSIEWMKTTLDFYHNFRWDYVVENNEVLLEDVRVGLLNMLKARDPVMEKYSSTRATQPMRIIRPIPMQPLSELEDGDLTYSGDGNWLATASVSPCKS